MRTGIVRRVATLALQIEPDRSRVLHWIVHTPLAAFGGHTTFELACDGQGERVVDLLRSLLEQSGPVPSHLPQAPVVR
jgi:hypothetical protein